MQALRKLFRLSPRELRLLVQASVLLPAVRLALQFASVADLQKLGRVVRRDPQVSDLTPRATARLVRVAAHRGLYRAKCLEQSLVLRWLLRRQGIDAQIFFGARKENEQMQAHAWVEVDGVSLDEDANSHRSFSPFAEPTISATN